MSIFPTAPYGSLLKGAKADKAPSKKAARKPPRKDMGRGARVKLPEHLDAIRQCQCVVCGAERQTEAAHVQIKVGPGSGAGVGMKADDCYVTPLCGEHHRNQHKMGEVRFWADVGLDPHDIAATLHRVSPNVEVMRAAVAMFLASAALGRGQ